MIKKNITLLFALLLSFNAFGVTRLYDRSAGDIVDADKDDAEWDNTNNAVNTHTADTSAHDATGGVVGVSKEQTLTNKSFGGDTNFFNAADISVYSTSTATTKKVFIDGATGATIAGLTKAGSFTNCGISNSGTTVTIAGYDGTALSDLNPCVIAVRSSTAGRVALAYFNSNVTFTHGSASDTDSNLFGITDANWASGMPLFLGVIYDGTTPYFVISRLPFIQSGAAATALCQKGDTDCDAKIDMMILTSGLTLANWVNLPITQVGYFQGTYATSGGAWTFSVSTKQGFNQDYGKENWTFPVAQMGGIESTHLIVSGGDASADVPKWATPASIIYTYTVDSEFRIGINFTTRQAGNCTNGDVGAALSVALPFTSGEGAEIFIGGIASIIGSTSYGDNVAQIADAGSSAAIAGSSLGGFNANAFSNTGDDLMVKLTYKAF